MSRRINYCLICKLKLSPYTRHRFCYQHLPRMSTGFRNGRPGVKSTIEVQMDDIEQELKELYRDINYLKDSLGKKWTKVNTLKTKLEIEKDRKKREELRKLAKTILTKEEDGDLYYSAEEHLQRILNNNNNN